jgi:ATP-binding cassette, subfamily F, member 3
MIEFQGVSKSYGSQDVLVDAVFRVMPGERVGIVGPNGAGKSTIFALIEGVAAPDRGVIVLPKHVRLGHLRQQLNAHAVDTSLLGYTERAIPKVEALGDEMEDLEAVLQGAAEGERTRLLDRLGRLQTEFEHLGGYELRTRAEKALGGLGFAEAGFGRPFRTFSGGWQMRAELARTLIGQPDILLLDEPSNYLDLPAVEWLQRYLREFPGTLLLISHDRYLLESLTAVTLEIERGRVTRYAGNFAYYVREREGRRARQAAAHKNQQRKRQQVERFVERFRAKNTKASQVQSRLKMLEKMEEVTAPEGGPDPTRIRIAPPPHCGAEVANLEGVGHSYDGEGWVLRGVDLAIQRGEKIALVGYNGMGKTTLLRILAGALVPREGRRRLGHQVVVGYQSQEFAETMPPAKSAYEIVRAAAPGASERDVRSLLGSFGFSGPQVDKPCDVLSGGEKIRLAFARIFIRPPNFLILDEPTTHLDIHGRRALEAALRDYAGTLCLVSHDIAFVRAVAERVIAMAPPGIVRYAGGYEYYCEKSAAASGGAASSPATPVPAAGGGKARRPARARRGDRQQELALRRAVRQAEQAVAALEEEQATLLAELVGGDGVDYAAVHRRLAVLQAELARHMQVWEQAMAALEEET